MTFSATPFVKGFFTVLGLGLIGVAQVPALAPYSPYLVPIGTAILGALHIQVPTVSSKLKQVNVE